MCSVSGTAPLIPRYGLFRRNQNLSAYDLDVYRIPNGKYISMGTITREGN
jgi:hypothetical protein